MQSSAQSCLVLCENDLTKRKSMEICCLSNLVLHVSWLPGCASLTGGINLSCLHSSWIMKDHQANYKGRTNQGCKGHLKNEMTKTKMKTKGQGMPTVLQNPQKCIQGVARIPCRAKRAMHGKCMVNIITDVSLQHF